MPDLQYVDLPTSDLFHNVRIEDNHSPAGFYFEISNMSHKIPLPQSFAKYLPMRPVEFKLLHARTQHAI